MTRYFKSEVDMMNCFCPEVMANSAVINRGHLMCAGHECVAFCKKEVIDSGGYVEVCYCSRCFDDKEYKWVN